MTMCHDEMFTCRYNGYCIPSEQRCDLINQCIDHSDELGCSNIKLTSDYNPGVSPPAETFGGYIHVSSELFIISFRSFNITKPLISIDLAMIIKWKDYRLKYLHLKYHADNKIENISSVWKPEVHFEDGAMSACDVKLRSEQIFIDREAEPIENVEGMYLNVYWIGLLLDTEIDFSQIM